MASDTPHPDRVLAQLRKLREGRGLNALGLQQSGDLMSALGTSDSTAALDGLLSQLRGLPDSPNVRALRVDLAVDLAELLGREPVDDELRLLTERRNGYAEVVGRDVKTLARWSDRAAAELRTTLLTDQFSGQLTVIGAVDADRVAGITVIRHGGDPLTGRDIRDELENPSALPSVPALIYGFPRDWRPSSLRLAIAFRREPYPSKVWAIVAPSFFDFTFAGDRHELALQDGMAMARIEQPRRDRVYGIAWVHRD